MKQTLLGIDTACKLVLASAPVLPVEEVALGAALGRVLAEDVVAEHDVPRFAGSAMDGFALRSGPAGRTLQLIGESRAGMPFDGSVEDGQAARISTGAAVPSGADAVLQLELVEDRGTAIVTQDAVTPGRNIRGPGEDLCAGTIVIARGTRLSPAHIGVGANAGRAAVRCARRPRVAILATGDELVPAGRPLGPGQIHDSNQLTLEALVQAEGAEVVHTRHVADRAEATRTALERALPLCDLLLISGGVSVGAHDHVKPALEALGVERQFWRVALRPGKPTWCGVRGKTLVLALPGNPVSVMVTFLLFARPALAAMQGATTADRRTVPLGEPLSPHPDRDECVRVRIEGGAAYATGPQGSHVLSSMALADGLAVIPRGNEQLPAGAIVDLVTL